MFETAHNFFLLHTSLWLTLLGTSLIGITAGIVGSFALLKKQTLLGDTMAHAALPGIAISLLFATTHHPTYLLIGGAIGSCIGVLLLHLILHTTRLKIDTVLGIILSSFFGLGLVMMTIAQKKSVPHQAVLNKFLFGNAALLMPTDLYLIATVCCLLLIIVGACWKECIVALFDGLYGYTIGYSSILLHIIITCMLMIITVVGLQTIGVILMSSLLIAPAAAARQWTSQLHTLILLAAVFGGTACIIGTLLSMQYEDVPTGPIIVLVASFFVAVSFLLSPKPTTRV